MNGTELKTARELLKLSQAEAAKEIGQVSQRSWSYWENNEFIIPKDVEKKINSLLNKRKEAISYYKKLLETTNHEDIVTIYYEDIQDIKNIVDLRFNQSLALTLHYDYGVNLIKFNKKSYEIYLEKNNLKNDDKNREKWAIEEFKNKSNN